MNNKQAERKRSITLSFHAREIFFQCLACCHGDVMELQPVTGSIHSISSDYAPILQGPDRISDVKRMMREFGVEQKSGHLKINSAPAFLNILNSPHIAVLNLTENALISLSVCRMPRFHRWNCESVAETLRLRMSVNESVINLDLSR